MRHYVLGGSCEIKKFLYIFIYFIKKKVVGEPLAEQVSRKKFGSSLPWRQNLRRNGFGKNTLKGEPLAKQLAYPNCKGPF